MQRQLIDYVGRNQARLFEHTRELVRRPPENTPPAGAEGASLRARLNGGICFPGLFIITPCARLSHCAQRQIGINPG